MRLFKISDVIQQTVNVKALRLTHLQGDDIDFLPGQYVDIAFANDKDMSVEGEYNSFSISSSPLTKGFIEIIVLDLGDFRHRLYNSKNGTILNIKWPYGRFIYNEITGLTPVFIAGGSGIAPIMSMIRYISQKYPKNGFTLIYSCKTENDIIFFKELKELAGFNKRFYCLLTLTHPSTGQKLCLAFPHVNFVVETGRIDESMIIRNIKDVASHSYYICGPYEMMIMINYILQKLGVPGGQINSELW